MRHFCVDPLHHYSILNHQPSLVTTFVVIIIVNYQCRCQSLTVSAITTTGNNYYYQLLLSVATTLTTCIIIIIFTAPVTFIVAATTTTINMPLLRPIFITNHLHYHNQHQLHHCQLTTNILLTTIYFLAITINTTNY